MANSSSLFDQAFFWLATLTILAASAFWLLRAGAKGLAQEGDRADIEVYADQVGEIDRDLAQGRISPSEADAGRLEIGRRLVKARDRVLTTGTRLNKRVLAFVTLGVVGATAGFYVAAGSPNMADMPFATRERELLSRDPASLSQDEILVLLQERARANPQDPLPHMLMGQVMMTAGRDQDALRAFQAVLRRTPTNAEAIAEAAGVLIRLNDKKIGPDAQQALDAALKINPNSPAARYYQGYFLWHKDQKAEAIEVWSKAYDALADKPEGQALIAARAAELMSALERGPGSQQGLAPMQNVDSADQSAMIGAMIGARRSRLEANPNDVALRLSVVRVLVMSGQSEEARKLLLQGVERPSATAFEIGMYQIAARSLVASSPSQKGERP
jgi:cytochrome c-type biogenesis protein CcmH